MCVIEVATAVALAADCLCAGTVPFVPAARVDPAHVPPVRAILDDAVCRQPLSAGCRDQRRDPVAAAGRPRRKDTVDMQLERRIIVTARLVEHDVVLGTVCKVRCGSRQDALLVVPAAKRGRASPQGQLTRPLREYNRPEALRLVGRV